MEHLSDLDRRVIGNLSIPRNTRELTLALTGYAYKMVPGEAPAFYTEDEINDLLDVYKAKGWVVNLGDERDAAKLASAAQKNKATMEFTDERAELWSSRVTNRPDFAWRTAGDSWMLSDEGLKALHAEPDHTPPPMTPQQVQATIDAEYARVHKGDIERNEEGAITNVNLSNKLLEDEFHHWLKLVLADTKERWGEMAKDVHGPMAGGASGWSDAYEVSLIDAENQKTALGAVVDPWFMGLSILALTDADTGTTLDNGTHIPTYTGYARKSVAGTDMPAATSGAGSSANTSAIIFAACTAGTSTILAAANCVASTVGVLRKWFDVASTVISTTQTPAQFAVGQYTTSAA
jgi:hypothetical protein